jgi:Tol biopolymer transport system component
VADADGGNATVIARAGCVDWSPDGKELAFYADIGNYQFRVFVMDANGTDVRQVARGYGVPAWSPDGTRLAFYSGNYAVTIFDLATGEWRVVAHASTEFSDHPDWSPDGTRVFFVKNDDLWTVNVRTGQALDVTDTADRYESEPAWSPDGRRIVARVANGIDGCLCVATMNPDGTGARVVVHGVATMPDWQPLPG